MPVSVPVVVDIAPSAQQQEWAALSEDVQALCLPPLNEKLANYDLKRTLGKGGYGSVYLAQNTKEGDRVAIKVVKKSRLAEKRLGGAAEMTNEMDILRTLTEHWKVCPMFTKIHDTFQDGHNYYFVMDYVSGGSLADELENSGCVFSERRVQYYIAQILLGASFLHAMGIIHRDLKPENCLITRDGRITIADFGLATKLEHGSPSNYCGTPGYTAPEVYLQQIYSFPVDSWALGCIAYELLVGRVSSLCALVRSAEADHTSIQVPFDHEDLNQIRHLTLVDTVVFPPHVALSDNAKDFIRCVSTTSMVVPVPNAHSPFS